MADHNGQPSENSYLLLASFFAIGLSKLLKFESKFSYSGLGCLVSDFVEIGLNSGHCLIHFSYEFFHNFDI